MESAVLIWTVGYQREARELQSAGNVITLSETATAEASTVARQEVISMSQTVRYCTFVPADGADEAARSAADTRSGRAGGEEAAGPRIQVEASCRRTGHNVDEHTTRKPSGED